MTVDEHNIQVSFKQLLDAVSKLDADDLERFAEQVDAMRRQRYSGMTEPQLLALTQQPGDHELSARYQLLLTKHRSENLDEQEYQELLVLTDHMEKSHAQRLEALAQLAQRRNTSLDDVLDLLPIHD